MNWRVRTFCALLTTPASPAVHAQVVQKPTLAEPALRADAEVVRELIELEKSLAGLEATALTVASGAARERLLTRIRDAASRLDRVVGRIRSGGEIPSPDAPLPMADVDFARLLTALDAEAFAPRRLATLRDAARNNPLTVHQLTLVLERFSFPAERVDAVRAVAPRLVDPEHGYELSAAFRFDDDREEVRKILENTARPAP
jgi:hypothetical protein